MATKANTGPGRAQRKGRSIGGRTTAKGSGGQGASRVGRYTPAVESGRYTPPIPKEVRRSPPWFGVLVLALMVLGVLTILLNYMDLLPYGVKVWYLICGLALIFVGFLMATRYH